MKKYKIQFKVDGTMIETNLTIEQAKSLIEEYEAQDKAEGIFEPDYYEIVEIEGGNQK